MKAADLASSCELVVIGGGPAGLAAAAQAKIEIAAKLRKMWD